MVRYVTVPVQLKEVKLFILINMTLDADDAIDIVLVSSEARVKNIFPKISLDEMCSMLSSSHVYGHERTKKLRTFQTVS